MPKRVFILPPIPQIEDDSTVNKPCQLRAAAYCRVSTSKEEQLTSYETQLKYFENYIKSEPLYSFVGIYADEGISGTGLKKREAFNQMMRDAQEGKLDIIITKSISRFGRNTLDSLKSIRELKALSVDVFFEKEGIHTKDSESEVILTLMMALAENESFNQSENVKWGIQRKYEKGQISSVPCGKFLGYEKIDGQLVINDAEAEIVRRIYKEFLSGYGTYQIASKLTAEGIPMTFGGKGWCPGHIKKVLTNEKYKGDTLFLKTFNSDPLTKKRIKNTGLRHQYYCEDTHPAIIDKNTWECVQLEFKRQKQNCDKLHIPKFQNRGSAETLSGRLVCGICGHTFMQISSKRVQEKGRKYWRCRSFKGCKGAEVNGMLFTPKPMALWSKNPDSSQAKYRAKHRKLPKPRQMLCTDVQIDIGKPEQAFVEAWNTLVEDQDCCAISEKDNVLNKYRKHELARLLRKYGKLNEMPFGLMLQTLDYIEIFPDGHLRVLFLAGIDLMM